MREEGRLLITVECQGQMDSCGGNIEVGKIYHFGPSWEVLSMTAKLGAHFNKGIFVWSFYYKVTKEGESSNCTLKKEDSALTR